MRKYLLYTAFLTLSFFFVACSDGDSDKSSNDDGTEAGENNDDGAETCDDASYIDSCDGDTLKYCSTKNQVVKINCSEIDSKKRTCAIFLKAEAENNECSEDDVDCQEEMNQPATEKDCINAELACTTENEEITRCEASASGYTYIRTYKCVKTTDDRMFYRRTASTSCYSGYGVCSDSGECLPPISCEDDYEDHCDGTKLYKCSLNRLRTADCANYTTPNSCAVIDGKANCYSPSKECTQEGEISVRSCNANLNREYIDICTKAADDKLYKESNGYRKCIAGCNADNSACAKVACPGGNSRMKSCRIQGTSTMYVDSYFCKDDGSGKMYWTFNYTDKCDNGHGTCTAEGECIPAEECVSKDFESRCDGDIAVTCSSKKVKYNHCYLSTGTSHCAMMDGKASCYADSNLCENEGDEKVSSCSSASNKERLKICKAASNGKNYWVSSGSRACPNGCNAEGTGCK